MNFAQICARLCPTHEPLGPPKDINALWYLWAAVFHLKAKRRVSSKVNKISDRSISILVLLYFWTLITGKI